MKAAMMKKISLLNSRFVSTVIAVGLLAGLAPLTVAQAGPANFSYEGRMYDSGGNPATGSATFTLRIYNQAQTCVVYEETTSSATDLTASNGYFSVAVGTGTPTANYAGRLLATEFSNRTTLSGFLNGSSCSFTPVATDGRYLEVVVTIAGTPTTMSPRVAIGTSPYAMMADDSELLGGLTPSSYATLNSAALTENNLLTIFSTGNYPNLLALVSGTSAQYAPASTSKGTVITSITGGGTPSSVAAGSIWYDASNNVMKYYNGTSSVQLSTSSSGGVSGVTSVGLSLPNLFTVANSPVTSAGTLSATLATQAASTVLAGPTSGGGSASPTFRQLVASDISGLDSTYVKVGGSTGAATGGILTVGTNDSYPVAVRTNAVTRLTISSSGAIGVGTSSPNAILDVYGSGASSAMLVPRDSTSNRPTGINGMIRFNTSTQMLETYANGMWTSLATSVNGATQWVTNGSAIFYGSGNVGIGSSAPAYPLDVAGPINTSYYLLAQQGLFASYSNSTTLKVDVNANGLKGSVLLGPSGSNVGIGTANPAAVLDIYAVGTASAVVLPRDSTSNRPVSPVAGMVRYNTTTGNFEGYANSGWTNFQTGGAGNAASVSSCTNGSITGGTQARGTVTFGGASATTCSIAFGATYASAPTCVASWSGSTTPTAVVSVSTTTTGLTFTFSSSVVSGTAVSYICMP